MHTLPAGRLPFARSEGQSCAVPAGRLANDLQFGQSCSGLDAVPAGRSVFAGIFHEMTPTGGGR